MSLEPIGKFQRPPLIEPVGGIERLLKAPDDIRNIMLRALSINDLKAFDIALSKGIKINAKLQPAIPQLHKQIKNAMQNALLQEILIDNSSWKDVVSSWGNISLEDKIWLLRLFELKQLGVALPIDNTPSASSLDLLKRKPEIIEVLSEVSQLDLRSEELKKCPKAICLLNNLEILILSNNKLTSPPDVSENVKLKELDLTNNQLTAPPDVSQNIILEYLILYKNQLTKAPNLRNNPKLAHLNISNNQLKDPPIVSQCIDLQILILQNNQLTIAPDVTHNVKLITLDLGENQLSIAPDVSHNVELGELYLKQNKITVAPDISKNGNLTLDIRRNKLDELNKQKLRELEHPQNIYL